MNSSFTLEEVQSIVQESTRHGLVDDDAGLITGALEFSEYTAADIMVPLDELVMLKAATTPVEFEKAVSRTGFSRFPMLDDDDLLYGYLHVKDVLSIPESAYGDPIAESRIRSLANLALGRRDRKGDVRHAAHRFAPCPRDRPRRQHAGVSCSLKM